jgi:hypothetical protein
MEKQPITAQEMGRMGGLVKSEAKKRAVINNLKRANAAKMQRYAERQAVKAQNAEIKTP